MGGAKGRGENKVCSDDKLSMNVSVPVRGLRTGAQTAVQWEALEWRSQLLSQGPGKGHIIV